MNTFPVCCSRPCLQARYKRGRLEVPERDPAAIERSRRSARSFETRDHQFGLRGRGQPDIRHLPLDFQ